MRTSEFAIQSKVVARACLFAIAVVVALHLASQILRFEFGRDYQLGLAAKLYLGAETSIPNWLSTILLLACAGILFVIGADNQRPEAKHWRGLGIIFLGLSLDEAAADGPSVIRNSPESVSTWRNNTVRNHAAPTTFPPTSARDLKR